MDDQDQQRVILRKYLLGELPEPDRSQLADQYFVDENFFDELLDVENELLDQYVCGQLRPDEGKNFRDYLTRLPDGYTKLATAYALNEARNQIRSTSLATISEDAQTPAVAAPVLLSRWEIFRAFLFGRGHLPQYVAVAILIAALCGLAFLIISSRREVKQLRAEQTQTEQDRSNAQQQARVPQENEATIQEQKNQQNNRKSHALAVHVFSPALRSTGTPDSITISDATKSVLLVMPIPEDEQITTYDAMLRTTGGQFVWRNERVKPQKSRQGRTASLRLPAARLTQSSYKLTLQGTTNDGVEIAHDFYFNITKQRIPDRD